MGTTEVVEYPITFQVAERRLTGRSFTPTKAPQESPGLLFVHGLHSSQGGYRHRATHAAGVLGATCFTFDLSGHGTSDGGLNELTARDHLQDVLAAYDQLAALQNLDTGRIGICAASYGAYLAALAVSHRPTHRLLLRAPALYGDDVFDVAVTERPARRSNNDAPNLIQSLNEYPGEILVLESENDEVIPHETIETYLAACQRGYHKTIMDAGHELSTPEWDEAFVREIVNWFGSERVSG